MKLNIPYKNYNCSVIDLNSEDTKELTKGANDEKSILVTFFVSLSPNHRYGTMTWIGILSYQNEWIVKPHLLQNDLGPKCADVRIFKMRNNIGIIGYSRVAPGSNTPGIADYYVRSSKLETVLNDELYSEPTEIHKFKEIDGGCFPSKIKNNYKKLTGNTKVSNIEFRIKPNENSKNITPHWSRCREMPDSMKLNGIEVSFSKLGNEDNLTHVSSKNIVPLQHKTHLEHVACFVDFLPNNSTQVLLTIQHMETGKVKQLMSLFPVFKHFSGSTPIVELSDGRWVIILHRRQKDKNYMHGLRYDYKLVFFDSKVLGNITIPNNCIKTSNVDIGNFGKDFIFITGMFQMSPTEMMVSYGISDRESGASKLCLETGKLLKTEILNFV